MNPKTGEKELQRGAETRNIIYALDYLAIFVHEKKVFTLKDLYLGAILLNASVFILTTLFDVVNKGQK